MYNQHVRNMVKYCNENRKETIHIDGSHSVRTVQTAVLARCEQNQVDIK